MALGCIPLDDPKFIALSDVVGRFEATKDWMEYKGVIRTPDEVQAKLDRIKKINQIRNLRNNWGISQRSMTEKEGFTWVTIPKIFGDMDHIRGSQKGVIPIPRTLDKETYDEVNKYLTLEDIDWMTLHETPDSYYVKIPTDLYKDSLDKETASYFREEAKVKEDIGNKLIDFVKGLGIDVKQFDDLKEVTGYDTISATDLINKVMLFSRNSNYTNIEKETAYVAYSLLGKKNKIVTDLKHSIENLDNYQELYDKYKNKSPNLNGYKIRELIIVDFIADAIHNNFEAPKDSYINRQSEFWGIKSNSKIEKQLKYLLIKIKQFLQNLLVNTKLSNTQLNDLANDIANDILTKNYDKFQKELNPEQQLVNYEETIAKDDTANKIVKDLQSIGLILTGSLALRKSGTIFRTGKEILHDLDFTIQSSELDKESQAILGKTYTTVYGTSSVTHIDELIKGKFFRKIYKLYPSFKIDTIFKNKNNNNAYTILGKIGDYSVDFFIIDSQDKSVEGNEKGFQTWESIFAAKIRMGRAKDLMDFINFKPFNIIDNKFAQEKGLRHFTFEKNNEKSLISPEKFESQELDPETLEGYLIGNLPDIDPLTDQVNTDTARAIEIVTNLSEQLSSQLGIPYQNLTREQATELTKNAHNKWKGEPAFFFGNSVYFVGTNLSVERAFHEFSHPLIRAINKSNPTLFDDLYDKLMQTEEGKEIFDTVTKLYAEDFDHDSDLFKEEVLVRALSKSAATKFDKLQEPKGFRKIINDILYAIKQLLRKVFGQKVDVSKLDSSTTLNTLADMLSKGDKFKINTEQVTNEQVAAYEKTVLQTLAQMDSVDQDKMITWAIKGHKIAQDHVGKLMKDENYAEMANILKDKYGNLWFESIKGNLRKHATFLNDQMQHIKDDFEATEKRSEAMVNTLFTLKTVMKGIDDYMSGVIKDPDDKNNLIKTTYYETLITSWNAFINTGNEVISSYEVKHVEGIKDLLDDVSKYIDSAKKKIGQVKMIASRDILFETLQFAVKDMDEKFEKDLKWLRDKKYAQYRIDRLYENYHGVTEAEYKELRELEKIQRPGIETLYRRENLQVKSAQGIRISKEKIERMLKGEYQDAKWFNSMVEGYGYNEDPIVGGIAQYVRNQMSDVLLTTHKKANTYYEAISKLYKESGRDPKDVGRIGIDMGRKDSIRAFNSETGKWEEQKEWVFKNNFKDWRYDYDTAVDNAEEAMQQFIQTKNKEDGEKARELVAIKNKLLTDYFNQQYVQEYYDRYSLLEKDEIGKVAKERREAIFDEMNRLNQLPDTTPEDLFQISDRINELWKKYRQLSSRIDNYTGLEKTGGELEVAERLKEYNALSRKFYEYSERPEVFKAALVSFEESLIRGTNVTPGLAKDSPEFKEKRQKWLDRNLRTVLDEEYYEKVRNLVTQIKAITDTFPSDTKAKKDIADLYAKLFDIVTGHRDQDGQPDATNMTEETIKVIKELQDEIDDAKEDLASNSGLTKADEKRYWVLVKRMKDDTGMPQRLSYADQMEYNDLKSKRISDSSKKALTNLFEQLADLSVKEPTDYYLDVVNDMISKLNTDKLFELTGVRSFTKESGNLLLRDDVLDDLFKQSPQFKVWFEKNHRQKEVFDYNTRQEDYKWFRLYCWDVTRPTDPRYIKTTTITREDGSTETFNGVPSFKYFTRKVKDEYQTGYNPQTKEVKLIVGLHVDNKGHYLPRINAVGDKYIDHDYIKMKNANPNSQEDKDFKLLEKLKEFHLSYQEDLDNSSKLYLSFPRVRKETYEIVNTSGASKAYISPVQQWFRRVKSFFTSSKDDPELGMNWDLKDNTKILDQDFMINNETAGIIKPYQVPITGLYNLNVDDVSTELTHTMMQYMYSIEEHKKLVSLLPVVNALKATLADPANGLKNMKKIEKVNLMGRTITYANKEGVYGRKKYVDNYLAQTFQGQNLAGWGSDNVALNKTANFMLKHTANAFFPLNFISAAKNYFGQSFQTYIEGAAGRWVNTSSILSTYGWAGLTTAEVSTQIYNNGVKSLNVQLVERFDLMNRLKKNMGRSFARSLTKDIIDNPFGILMNFRKWSELEATVHTFAAMMKFQTVKQNGKDIPYLEAWELKDDQLVLKEGIDKEWGEITDDEGNVRAGKNYAEFRQKIDQVMTKVNGPFMKEDKSNADRFLVYRMFAFMKTFFIPQFLNRFAFSTNNGNLLKPRERFSPVIGGTQEGFYITFLRTVIDKIRDKGTTLGSATPEERRAVKRMMVEGLMIFALYVIGSAVLGWDPDDPDKYEKMRKRSGPLPGPGVADSGYDFHTGGFLVNQALSLILAIKAENEQFLPLPGMGLNDYVKMANPKSIAMGPTFQAYIQLFTDLAGGNKGYQATVGPYEWQQQGSGKFWNHLFTSYGLNGNQVDPTKAIKGLMTSQNTIR